LSGRRYLGNPSLKQSSIKKGTQRQSGEITMAGPTAGLADELHRVWDLTALRQWERADLSESIYQSIVDPKRVVVTGAASGMGKATVEVLRERGCAVAALDISPTVRDVDAEFHAIVDVADLDAMVRALDDAAEALGGLEAIVPVAGIVVWGTIDETTSEDWSRQFDVNARGVFNASKAALPHLRTAGGGAIVAVTSQVGLVGAPAVAAYCASKAAAIELVRCMAIDHAHEGIRVNAVCPGITRTPMFERMLDQFESGPEREAEMTRLKETNLQKRLIEPREIAEAVAFLVSASSPAILGTTLVVDGGYTTQ
jgi:2-keto-3-deoxy-L-fuconate dehydrogenase